MQEPSNLQVVLIGLITVFVCLIVLIILMNLMSAIIRLFVKDSAEMSYATANQAPAQSYAPESQAPTQSYTPVNQAPTQSASVPAANSDKQKLVAAISVSIAEYMGTDVSHIKIQSIKKI